MNHSLRGHMILLVESIETIRSYYFPKASAKTSFFFLTRLRAYFPESLLEALCILIPVGVCLSGTIELAGKKKNSTGFFRLFKAWTNLHNSSERDKREKITVRACARWRIARAKILVDVAPYWAFNQQEGAVFNWFYLLLQICSRRQSTSIITKTSFLLVQADSEKLEAFVII